MSSPLEFRVLLASIHAAAASSSSLLPYTTIIVTAAIYLHRHHRCHIPPLSSPLPYTTYPLPSRQSESTCIIYLPPVRVPPDSSPPPVRVPPDSSPPPVLVRVQYFVTLFWISRSRDTPSRDSVGLLNFRATRRRKIVPN